MLRREKKNHIKNENYGGQSKEEKKLLIKIIRDIRYIC